MPVITICLQWFMYETHVRFFFFFFFLSFSHEIFLSHSESPHHEIIESKCAQRIMKHNNENNAPTKWHRKRINKSFLPKLISIICSIIYYNKHYIIVATALHCLNDRFDFFLLRSYFHSIVELLWRFSPDGNSICIRFWVNYFQVYTSHHGGMLSANLDTFIVTVRPYYRRLYAVCCVRFFFVCDLHKGAHNDGLLFSFLMKHVC